MSRSTLYLGGPALGAQVVPVNAGSGVYGGQTGSVLIKNCNAKPVDNADLTNKRYVDDTITSVINSIEGLGNISHSTLANITSLVGDQTARGSILNNALVIQALENSLGMDIADNLGTGASGNTGTNVNTQFLPSLLRNPEVIESVTDFSLNAFLADVRRGDLDTKVPDNSEPTLADHLSNLYSINVDNNTVINGKISTSGSVTTRNSNETIDSQLGELYSQLTGDDSGETLITSRQATENVNDQLGNLYSQLVGVDTGGSLTTRGQSSVNVNSQLDEVYTQLSGSNTGLITTRLTINNLNSQIGNIYANLVGNADGGTLTSTNRFTDLYNENNSVNAQLGFLFLRLNELYEYFLNHNLNTAPPTG
jgi:hypothetical protein